MKQQISFSSDKVCEAPELMHFATEATGEATVFRRHLITSTCLKHAKNKMDTATLNIEAKEHGLSYWWQSQECYKCPLVRVCELHEGTKVAQIDSVFASKIAIKDSANEIVCQKSCHFGEHGVYNWSVSKEGCNFTVDSPPDHTNLPIFYAFLIYLTLLLVYFGVVWYLRFARLSSTESTQEITSEQSNENSEVSENKPKKRERLRFLDVFRGLCIAIMIFVNYGGGGYYFFRHSEWNGLTVADLVFPWFMFIMGTSMALSFESLSVKCIPKRKIYYKIGRRTVILFGLGIFIVNAPRSWETLRIPGVLQRFAIAYCFVASVRALTATPSSIIREKQRDMLASDQKWSKIASYFIDIWHYWIEWILYFAIVIIWLCFTFLLPVQGCPRGYIGPGGLAEDAKYVNCTGGAAGLIDRKIMGSKHIYAHPTSARLYDSNMPYDPEGLLGSLMSVVAVFLGLQAGQILLLYDDVKSRTVRLLLWALGYGILAGALCGFSQNDGAIPVNKNLWSLSFILSLSCFANVLIVVLYLLNDVLKYWPGAPFYFVGMNSIAMYVLHEVFSGALFVGGWSTSDNHASKLFAHLWGTTFWVIVAYYMHHIEFYVII